jgi:hypothetical protein
VQVVASERGKAGFGYVLDRGVRGVCSECVGEGVLY